MKNHDLLLKIHYRIKEIEIGLHYRVERDIAKPLQKNWQDQSSRERT